MIKTTQDHSGQFFRQFELWALQSSVPKTLMTALLHHRIINITKLKLKDRDDLQVPSFYFISNFCDRVVLLVQTPYYPG